MKWFKEGMDENALKKEYRRLAKQYHPDVSGDDGETFKEIGKEFNEYFTREKIKDDFSWVKPWTSENPFPNTETRVLYLRRDRENPGRFFTILEYYRGYWGASPNITKGITDDSEDWKGFRGGLAYCEYEALDRIYDYETVSLKKRPAKLTPASLNEIYWFIQENSESYMYGDRWLSQVKCPSGTFWAVDVLNGFQFLVKIEIPKEVINIGNVTQKEEDLYGSRTITRVDVVGKWTKSLEIKDCIKSYDVGFKLYQDCTYEEFKKYHDVDYSPEYITRTFAVPVREDFWFIPDPVIMYYAQLGLLKFYRSSQNFRIRYGTFDSTMLKQNVHLLSIEDAEMIQDYLDKINQEFEDHVLALIKKGKLKITSNI